MTVNLGVPVTVNMDTLRLVTAYKPPDEEKAADGQGDMSHR
ncbi:hypothetical protein ACWGS9_03255 [Bradyrhizobium sp. Arg314]